MSPFPLDLRAFGAGFPRVSGDEPKPASVSMLPSQFSPRERG